MNSAFLDACFVLKCSRAACMPFYVGYPPDPLYTRGRNSRVSQMAGMEKLPLRCIAVPSCGKCENGLLASFRFVRNLFEISNSAAHKTNSKFEKKACLGMFIFHKYCVRPETLNFFEKTINVDIFCYFMINLVIP